ncbi:MAG: C25 family peptidase propeptide domain-containing protein [Bacteroidales bacterium]|nr:C25 family peptidase propeptide domain-containing protein [Bacteroidales bacterium]
MKKFYLISLLMLIAYMANSQVNSNLQTGQSQIAFTVDNNYDRIDINYPFSTKTFSSKQGNYGKPEIPIVQKRYLIPINAEQVSVQITNATEQTISGLYNIYPEQPPILLNGMPAPEWVEPDQDTYNSNNPFPGKIVEIAHVEFTFGYQIVTVNLYPISYLPLSQTLKLYSELSFQIIYTLNTSLDNRPEKISAYMDQLTYNHILKSVSNPLDIGNFLGGGKEVVQNNSNKKTDYELFTCFRGQCT